MSIALAQPISAAQTFHDYWRLSDADVHRIQRTASGLRRIEEDALRLGKFAAISAYLDRVL